MKNDKIWKILSIIAIIISLIVIVININRHGIEVLNLPISAEFNIPEDSKIIGLELSNKACRIQVIKENGDSEWIFQQVCN